MTGISTLVDRTHISSVDAFIDGVVVDFRRRLALLDGGDRRAVEDALALLTDYRGMGEDQLMKLLAALRAGRSPVRLQVLRPEAIGGELAHRWEEYRSRALAAAGN